MTPLIRGRKYFLLREAAHCPNKWDLMKNIKLTVLLLAAFGIAISTSCSTTKGFGQDLQKVGDRIETRAESTGGTN